MVTDVNNEGQRRTREGAAAGGRGGRRGAAARGGKGRGRRAEQCAGDECAHALCRPRETPQRAPRGRPPPPLHAGSNFISTFPSQHIVARSYLNFL